MSDDPQTSGDYLHGPCGVRDDDLDYGPCLRPIGHEDRDQPTHLADGVRWRRRVSWRYVDVEDASADA